MGASAVLMTSGEKLPVQVKLIVADSPYTSVYDMFAYQMKRKYKFPDKPILFIHGKEDSIVPTHMVLKLSDATKSEHEVLTVEGVGYGVSHTL